MTPDSTDPESLDQFIENADPIKRCSAREVIELMRSRLGDAEERIEWGMAIFSKDGKDITGVGIEDEKLKVYVPDTEIVDEFSSRLGKVESGTDNVQFEELADVKRPELKKLIDRLDQEKGENPAS